MTRPDPASTLLRQAQRGLDPLPCAYYTAAECRSCTMLGMSHQDQIASKQAGSRPRTAGRLCRPRSMRLGRPGSPPL
ncbi:hypothetical protein [Dermatophilus congolensis]|uniref:hypothetical protein n=1 Tax=Dermatophilus congolensis TaxID=1863 RepID=UPI001FBB3628|nr:hypothetical protein [Dermatophilus congolensis]